MAYEMLTGRQPFEATTPTAVMMKRLAGPPPPVSKIRPDVPRDMQDAIDGMLAADPAERFQSADDVVRALGGARRARRRRSSWSRRGEATQR